MRYTALRYLLLAAFVTLSGCDSSDEDNSSVMQNADDEMSAPLDADAGITYSDANISFNYPDTWSVIPNAETGEIVLTNQEANEAGTIDSCVISSFERPDQTLVELTLAYAENTLLPDPAPTFTYLTVNNQEVSRVQGFMQIGFAAAPVLTQIMYQNDTATTFFCATVDLDDDIKLMFDSAVAY